MPCDVLTQHPLLEQVYEAAGGRGQVDVPRPPSKRLTQVLQLLTESCLDTFQRRRQQREEDASQGRRQVFEECSRYMDEAIAVADAQHLILVAADCRLLKARVVTDLASRKEMAMAEEERDSLLDWVIRHPSEVVCPARRARARALKSLGFISAEEKRAAIQAVMRTRPRTSSNAPTATSIGWASAVAPCRRVAAWSAASASEEETTPWPMETDKQLPPVHSPNDNDDDDDEKDKDTDM